MTCAGLPNTAIHSTGDSLQREGAFWCVAGTGERHERWIERLHVGRPRDGSRGFAERELGIAHDGQFDFRLPAREAAKIYHLSALGVEEVDHSQG